MTEENANTLKTVSAFLVIIVGLVVMAVLVVKLSVAGGQWKPAEITALVGALTTFLGSVVGSFLGIQIGAAGKGKLEGEKERAQETANLALAALQPDEAKKIAQR